MRDRETDPDLRGREDRVIERERMGGSEWTTRECKRERERKIHQCTTAAATDHLRLPSRLFFYFNCPFDLFFLPGDLSRIYWLCFFIDQQTQPTIWIPHLEAVKVFGKYSVVLRHDQLGSGPDLRDK
ncbi:hypothetical protein WN55_04059 [Dufourea novaeangliae]|uniref:Uncharacterized protein n=1 Tax=Dufourea novaeangliae TaxID=178035 RepID=A0A154NX32_DUFNO|nr:hypothetical protein WN55_04059 [Dufourea novaeangliae]